MIVYRVLLVHTGLLEEISGRAISDIDFDMTDVG